MITFIFLNSSFFNQNQWKKLIQLFSRRFKEEDNVQFITYDYCYYELNENQSERNIISFLEELNIIIQYFQSKQVHLFGMSIGAWIGLNEYFYHHNIICSYTGFGNIIPNHPHFHKLLQSFGNPDNLITKFNEFRHESITESNWDLILETFYIPFFFPKSNDKHTSTLSKILYPLVKGLEVDFLIQLIQYIFNTIHHDYDILEPKLTNQIKKNIFLINGKKDFIANYEMTLFLANKIPEAKTKLFENMGHGSIILNKGNNELIQNYYQFLKEKLFF